MKSTFEEFGTAVSPVSVVNGEVVDQRPLLFILSVLSDIRDDGHSVLVVVSNESFGGIHPVKDPLVEVLERVDLGMGNELE